MENGAYKAPLLTQEDLKSVIEYDHDTGVFIWIVDRGSRARKGFEAGNVNATTGYRAITIDKKPYLAQRLAFLYMTGSMPENHVDHINRDRLDNRWRNLRGVTIYENHRNRSKHKSNTSGVNGVYWNKAAGKWHAQIKINYRTKSLGLYGSLLDAVAARFRANKRYEFESTHGM